MLIGQLLGNDASLIKLRSALGKMLGCIFNYYNSLCSLTISVIYASEINIQQSVTQLFEEV